MLKHYKIKSAPRFIAFITICTLALIFAVISVTGINNAEGLSDESAAAQYRQVEVCCGDTLWELAAEYGPSDTDIRETVHTICKLNNVKAGSIQEGDLLLIPSGI